MRQTGNPLDDARIKAETANLNAASRLLAIQIRKAEAEEQAAKEADDAAATAATDPLAKRKADAVTEKEIAEAERDAARARRDQISDLIPDLSKVKASTLDVAKDGPAIGATQLSFGAIAAAAERVAEDVQIVLGFKKEYTDRVTGTPPPSSGATEAGTPAADGTSNSSGAEAWILVTGDPDLATPDGTYREVTNGLEQLATAARKMLEDTDPERLPLVAALASDELEVESFASAPLIGALAGAIPSVLSLLSTERSIRTASTTSNDLAGAAAVAGALRARTRKIAVIHEDFRLIYGSTVHDGVDQVSQCRQDLVARKLRLGELKTEADTQLPAAEALLKDLTAAKKPDKAQVDEARAAVRRLKATSANAGTRSAAIDSLLAAIDQFTVALRAIPTGGVRSALTTATLQELLHPSGADGTVDAKVGHVLLVKSEGGSALQATENKPLWVDDRYSSVVDASITYMLLRTTDSQILAADTVTAVATASGKIGESITRVTTAIPGTATADRGNWQDVHRTPRRDPGAW